MDAQNITSVFAAMADLRVGVIGDFAVDFYFQLEKNTGETSLETGKTVYRGIHPRTHLGAAGNVVQNLNALGVGTIYTFGILRDDIFGRELLYLLQQLEVHTDAMMVREARWDSPAYVKPIEDQEEEHRIDFGSYNQADEASRSLVLDLLEHALPHLDVVIMNQQFVSPLLDDAAICRLNEIARHHPHCQFFADLRSLGDRVKGITLKVNTEEAARMLGLSSTCTDDEGWCKAQAEKLGHKIQAPVLMTRGENGMLYGYPEGKTLLINGIYVQGEVDPVGAGDTAVSTFAACSGVGASPALALEIANLAAAITISKRQQTGTASPDEILQLCKDHAFIYHTDLAAHVDKATYLPRTLIEIVESALTQRQIQHVVFDHDGTISLLRAGWEDIMLEVMVDNITDGEDQALSPARKQNMVAKVKQLIEQTTGLPTLVQMQGLVQLIREEGVVPQHRIRNAEAYKAQYLEKLDRYVQERVEGYEQKGKEFALRGSREFLAALSERKVKLYLASGTDEPDVKREAAILGYAHFFNDGIYGARPHQPGAKRRVITEILERHYCLGENIAVIGDGPAEMREGRRVGALCIGVASDDTGSGLNEKKRKELIRAGAHVIIPDFLAYEQLLTLM